MDMASDVCVGVRARGCVVGNDSGEIARGRKADARIHMRTFDKHPAQRTEGVTDTSDIYL